MDKQQFEERFKIACFRSITKQLREHCLITRAEFKQIQKHLEQMELDLLAGKPEISTHTRKLSPVK